MAINQRLARTTSNSEVIALVDGDDKIAKEQSQKAILTRKLVSVFALLAILFVIHVERIRKSHDLLAIGLPASTFGSERKNDETYELYPFLVSPEDVSASVSSSRSGTVLKKVLSTPTLPAFPINDELENCNLAYVPSGSPLGKKDDWRPKFWIPSIPGSGASNPTNKGNLLREIITGIFVGNGKGNWVNPVKDYHVSIKNKLKHCNGVSETVGCTTNHPLVTVRTEWNKRDFRSETIVSLRNPATVIPAQFAYKSIAYRDAKKQDSIETWRNMRDLYWRDSFEHWIELIKFWRGTTDESSNYFTTVYVAFEDIVTTDASRGIAKIKELSDAVSGRKKDGKTKEGFFDTTISEDDYKCLWYKTAKNEWERQQTIIGDYIPPYTQHQKGKMVDDLNVFANEIESDPFRGNLDVALVSLLRRYILQIEKYVLVEEPQTEER